MAYTQSEHVKIRDVHEDIERVYNVLVDYAFDTMIKDKNYLRLRLLTEEVVRLVKEIMGSRSVALWFEGNNKVSHIVMECRGNLSENQKGELGSIATSGKITEEKGFFGKLADMFLIKTPEENTWSLKEYQRELKEKKDQDKYSLEAWEDLERSLVANLADDIVITSDDEYITMVVTKDFSKSLAYIPANALEAVSSQMIVGTGKTVSVSLSRAEELIEEVELEGRNAMHAKLVLEETLGMLQEMTGNYNAVIWLEKYKKSYCVKLTAKTTMDYDKKSDLLSLASDHKNKSLKGFMDKVSDVIQNGLLNYEKVAALSQEYNTGFVNYGSLGMYGGIEGIPQYGVMWSLNDYKENLDDARSDDEGAGEAWDELEKSIVANIANDVLVGVKGDRVDMTIICKLN